MAAAKSKGKYYSAVCNRTHAKRASKLIALLLFLQDARLVWTGAESFQPLLQDRIVMKWNLYQRVPIQEYCQATCTFW